MLDKFGENELPKGKLSDYFDVSRKLKNNLDTVNLENKKAKIQSFISINNHNAKNGMKSYFSGYYLPRKEFVKYLSENMLAIDYDSIFCEIVIRENNECLLIASYNLILGTRWICELDFADVQKHFA